MVEKLTKQDHRFRKVWETRCAMWGPGCHDHVDDQFADSTERWLRHELKGMESNELLDQAQNKDHKWTEKWPNPTNAYQARAYKVAPDGAPGQEDRRKQWACYEWKKKGTCSRGEGCAFSHDPQTWKEFVPRADKGAGKGQQPPDTAVQSPGSVKQE